MDLTQFAQRRQALLERLRTRADNSNWCDLYSDLVDSLVRDLCEGVLAEHPGAPPISVVAVGGYGRRELAPHSDIDLTVVPLEEAAPGLDETIKALFRALHSVVGERLKIEIDYAYTLVNDAPGLDETPRTGLMDSRVVAGSPEPYGALMNLFWETFPIADFLISKIEERRTAFSKFNDTPLVAEPNIKEGAGGIRCFQAANWLRMAIGERPSRRTTAYSWMLELRNHLHLVAGRRHDQLSRQRQAEIGDMLGMDVFEMMSTCAAHGELLLSDYEAARRHLYEARFSLGGGIVSVRGEARSLSVAPASANALGVAKAINLGIQVENEAFPTTGEVVGADALAAIGSGEQALRGMDRCGILGQLLPELTACKTLMPRDSAHKYTVFEHTIRAFRVLENVPPNSFLGELKAGLPDITPLYLALLLHDVGKIDESKKPHSIGGAEMATKVCKRWRLNESISNQVVWLVREHLTMARILGMRDIFIPQTAAEFCRSVRDRERLDMLTLLTYADVSAVSEGTWTLTQESLLAELYRRSAALLEEPGGEKQDDPSVHRNRLLRALRNEELPEAEIQSFLDRMPAPYLASTNSELVRLHIEYVRQAQEGTPVVELYHNAALATSELTVCCQDRAGLLSQILGVIYAFDLGIHSIRASTAQTEPPIALDSFQVSFGRKPLPTATANQLIATLKSCLEGKKHYEQVLQERGKDPERTQESFSYTYVEGSPSILEIQAPRGRGMAFRLSRLIASRGWNISAARVGQWAGQGAAAFYLLGAGNRRISRKEVDAAMKHV
jgi:[protein-PII] uridylyltransferase